MNQNSFNPQSSLGNTKIPPMVIVSTIILLVLASILYVSKNLFPTKTSPSALNPTARATLLSPDNKSGCIFSLGFEVDAKIDPSLKEEAFTKLNLLKNDILGGSISGADLVQVISTGMRPNEAQTRRKERFENPEEYARSYANWINPYAKFLNGITTNFCFKDGIERHAFLNIYFYEDNPDFYTNFNILKPSEVSSPFSIYHITNQGKKEYAVMMIYREK